MATQNQFTVQSICQLISDIRGEATVNTNANRIRFISNAEQDFARRRFWRIHRLDDQSIGTGDGTTASFTVGSATFPYRPKGLFELFVGGTTEDKRHMIVDEAKFKNLFNMDNSTPMVYEWYDQTNDLWKIKINPIPKSGDAITGSYYFMPPDRTATTDVVYCYNNNIVARGALSDIYHAEDELLKEQQQDQIVEELIQEAMAIENVPAVGQTYAMTAQENSSRPNGIGTY